MNDVQCPQCDGEPALLGCLGRLAWFRCAHCGWQFSLPVEEVA